MSKYDDMQANLLPSGFAWLRRVGSNLMKLLQSRSAGYDEVDTRTGELIDEAIPSSTVELLPDWESVCGLPDPLLADVEQTEAQRRDAVLARLIASGSLSKAFLIQVALNYGYVVTIEEFFDETEGEHSARCGTALCGGAICDGNLEWIFTFNVISDDEFATYARCGTARCGDRMAEYGDTTLQVVITRHKPAHTVDVYNLYQ